MMQQPVLLSPKFEAKSLHIFMQSQWSVTVVYRIDCLFCQDEFFVNIPLGVKENYEHGLDFALHLFHLLSVSVVSLDFPCIAYAFFPKRLSNYCQGLCPTFSEICTKFYGCSFVDRSHQASTQLHIKGHKNQHIHSAVWNFVHRLPRYASTIICLFIMLLQLLYRWQQQPQKLWILPRTGESGSDIFWSTFNPDRNGSFLDVFSNSLLLNMTFCSLLCRQKRDQCLVKWHYLFFLIICTCYSVTHENVSSERIILNKNLGILGAPTIYWYGIPINGFLILYRHEFHINSVINIIWYNILIVIWILLLFSGCVLSFWEICITLRGSWWQCYGL
jgi:hypothetical protein